MTARRAPPFAFVRGATFDPAALPAPPDCGPVFVGAPEPFAAVRLAGARFLAAVLAVRTADLVDFRPRGLVDFFREEAALEVPLALRLAMGGVLSEP